MIATTSHSTKAYRLRALGADAVVNYLEVPEWGERVRELTNGRGVERVVEVGGPGTIEQSLRAVAYGGEIAFMGYLSKDNPSLDFFKLKHSGAVFRNIMVGDRAGLEDLARTIEMAKIQPVIDRVFDCEAAQDALAYLGTDSMLGKSSSTSSTRVETGRSRYVPGPHCPPNFGASGGLSILRRTLWASLIRLPNMRMLKWTPTVPLAEGGACT